MKMRLNLFVVSCVLGFCAFGLYLLGRAAGSKIETDSGLSLSMCDVAVIQRLALHAHPGEIEVIHAGEISLPCGPKQARVIYRPISNDTTVINTRVDVWNPKWLTSDEIRLRGLNPSSGWQLSKGSVRVWVSRIFKLKSATLVLEVPDALSYDHLKGLLDVIDAGAYTTSGSLLIPIPLHVSEITWVTCNVEGAVNLSTGYSGGEVFTFRVSKTGEWELIAVSSYCV